MIEYAIPLVMISDQYYYIDSHGYISEFDGRPPFCGDWITLEKADLHIKKFEEERNKKLQKKEIQGFKLIRMNMIDYKSEELNNQERIITV